MRFIDYNPMSSTEAFFYNILLQHIPFRDESELISSPNTQQSYILECKLRGLIHDIKSLQHYIQEYSQWNLYNEHIYDQLIDKLLQQHPYLDLDYTGDIRFGIDIPMNEDFELDTDPCFQHNFEEEKNNASFTKEQQRIFDVISTSNSRFFFIEGTPDTGKTFFIKYFTNHYICTAHKKKILCTPIGMTATKTISQCKYNTWPCQIPY